ncbi:ABC transporter ATP-binding protein [Phyllobacterium zundukense]|uniref:ABC transporter n=1 Tax=Phyllobacterium zundukense TaxID=1867719 RepID=A0A2N9VX28_9HYPH|nr:sn-glycerol-3-phosphate ABC transporter ATP-binding protein UgpC [Phyllobacterium zundukense]ATU90306.1 ABC transporter [Phyllobacterium zundukense]PIO44046.1 ABC transporter [Phyllobacterium zundukense]
MATLTLNDIKKTYGTVQVIKGVDLEVADREFVVFVGPSGCGKSTLLRMIAGLEKISDGELLIDGIRANEVGPADRGLAMVFQSYALYPHMTIAENMGFALKIAGTPKAEREAKVKAAAEVLQLGPLLQRHPKELSGGQRQRVAIGRAIVRNPKVFLFDEPLSNLDAALRVQMRIELMRLHKSLDATMIYVTHDQVEAMTMADKIVVLNAGEIEQVGSPLDLYHHPRNLFVAGFIGSPKMNFLKAEIAQFDPRGVTLTLPDRAPLNVPVEPRGVTPGAEVTIGIRPEHLRIDPKGELHGQTLIAERLGGLTVLHVDVGGTMILVQTEGDNPIQPGEAVRLSFESDSVHVFDANGNALPHLARHPLLAEKLRVS